MIEQQLKDYKNIYKDITVPHHVVEEKWKLQKELLPIQDAPRTFYRFMPYGAVFASIAIFFFATIGFAQVAQPGNPLYPVKALTKNVTAKFSNTFQKQLPPTVSPPAHKIEKSNVSSHTSAPTIIPTNKPTEASEQNEQSFHSDNANKMIHTELKSADEVTVTPVAPVTQSVHNNFENVSSSNNTTKTQNNAEVKGTSTENSHTNNSSQSNNAKATNDNSKDNSSNKDNNSDNSNNGSDHGNGSLYSRNECPPLKTY